MEEIKTKKIAPSKKEFDRAKHNKQFPIKLYSL